MEKVSFHINIDLTTVLVAETIVSSDIPVDLVSTTSNTLCVRKKSHNTGIGMATRNQGLRARRLAHESMRDLKNPSRTQAARRNPKSLPLPSHTDNAAVEPTISTEPQGFPVDSTSHPIGFGEASYDDNDDNDDMKNQLSSPPNEQFSLPDSSIVPQRRESKIARLRKEAKQAKRDRKKLEDSIVRLECGLAIAICIHEFTKASIPGLFAVEILS